MRNVSTYFTCTFSHINLFFIFIFHFSFFIFDRYFLSFPFLFLLMRICSGNLSSLLLSSLCLWHVQFWVNLTSTYTLYKTALLSSIFYFHLFAALQYWILNLISSCYDSSYEREIKNEKKNTTKHEHLSFPLMWRFNHQSCTFTCFSLLRYFFIIINHLLCNLN